MGLEILALDNGALRSLPVSVLKEKPRFSRRNKASWILSASSTSVLERSRRRPGGMLPVYRKVGHEKAGEDGGLRWGGTRDKSPTYKVRDRRAGSGECRHQGYCLSHGG